MLFYCVVIVKCNYIHTHITSIRETMWSFLYITFCVIYHVGTDIIMGIIVNMTTAVATYSWRAAADGNAHPVVLQNYSFLRDKMSFNESKNNLVLKVTQHFVAHSWAHHS